MTEMKKRRIIVMNEDVLYEKELTLAEKCVYARIAGFEEYFESADECAELLGISVSTVQKAKSKLEKLGYITCIRNTGRGKAYRAVLDRQCEPDSQNLLIRLANSANQTSKICEHSNDIDKNIDLSTYVDKGDNVASETGNESNSQKDTKPTYGNSDINGMFDFWQETVGTPIISREKSNRRACYNLLRNKHIGEEKLRHAVEFVGEIKEDRFAPRISDFVDLQSKFNELCAYKTKYQAQQDVSDDKTPNRAVSSAMKGNNSAGGNVEFVPWRPTAGDLEREREWNEKERRQTEESAKVDPEWLEKLKQETIRKIYSHGDNK